MAKKKRPTTKRSEREYFAALNKALDDIYQASADLNWSWPVFADQAGIARSTVYKLGDRATRYPQLRTVYQLARAVGMDMVFLKARLGRKTA